MLNILKFVNKTEIHMWDDFSPQRYINVPKSDFYRFVYVCTAEVPNLDIKIIRPQSQGKK